VALWWGGVVARLMCSGVCVWWVGIVELAHCGEVFVWQVGVCHNPRHLYKIPFSFLI